MCHVDSIYLIVPCTLHIPHVPCTLHVPECAIHTPHTSCAVHTCTLHIPHVPCFALQKSAHGHGDVTPVASDVAHGGGTNIGQGWARCCPPSPSHEFHMPTPPIPPVSDQSIIHHNISTVCWVLLLVWYSAEMRPGGAGGVVRPGCAAG